MNEAALNLRVPSIQLGRALHPSRRSSGGIGDEAKWLQEEWDRLDDYAQTVTIGIRDQSLVEAIEGALAKAFEDAHVLVDPTAFESAIWFSRLLPSSVSLPDVYVESDGEICFEWDCGRRSIFSVSIGPNNRMTFAGLYGRSSFRGTETLGDAIPRSVLLGIERLAESLATTR